MQLLNFEMTTTKSSQLLLLPFVINDDDQVVEEIRRQMQLEEIGQELAPGKELDNMEALDTEVRYNCSTCLLIAG